MAKHRTQPRVVFCSDTIKVSELRASDPDSKALLSGPGTLSFHMLIAQHGAGEFKTLYVPKSLKGTFMCPAGAVIEECE